MIFENDEFDKIERDLQVLRSLGVRATDEDLKEIARARQQMSQHNDDDTFIALMHEYKLMFEAASIEVERLQKALLCVSVVAACLAAALIVRIVMF